MFPKCMTCVGEIIQARSQGKEPDNPVPNDAITFAPAWQEKLFQGTLVMACVTIPVCTDHIEFKEVTPLQSAINSGLMLPGMG
jgi:hypothetical protein